MKKYLPSLSLITTLGTLAVTSAFADQAPTGFSINPGAGYYSFDSEIPIENNEFPAIGLEYRFTDHLAVEANYLQGELDVEGGAATDLDWQQYRLDGIYYFSPQKKLQPFLTAGAGENTIEFNTGDEDETVATLGAGFKYFVNKAFSIRGDVKAINSLDEETTSSAAVLGLNILLGGGHASSNRGDLDLALSETTDSDKDGIFNAQDQCPDTPSGASVDSQGCPLDVDGDGIADYEDACLDTAPGTKVNSNGCLADDDLDGIANAQDACPETEEGLMVDGQGCPIELEKTLSMDLDVNFPLDSSVLPEEFYSDVKELATFMKLYKDTVAVIEGHADATGTESYNQRLSDRRAKTIQKLLVNEFGIESDRLKSVGYGESKPVATNATREGRKKNRRAATVVNTNISVSQPAEQ